MLHDKALGEQSSSSRHPSQAPNTEANRSSGLQMISPTSPAFESSQLRPQAICCKDKSLVPCPNSHSQNLRTSGCFGLPSFDVICYMVIASGTIPFTIALHVMLPASNSAREYLRCDDMTELTAQCHSWNQNKTTSKSRTRRNTQTHPLFHPLEKTCTHPQAEHTISTSQTRKWSRKTTGNTARNAARITLVQKWPWSIVHTVNT